MFTLCLEISVDVKSCLFFNAHVKASQQNNWIAESVENFLRQGVFLTIHELQAYSDEVTGLRTFLNLTSVNCLRVNVVSGQESHPQLS